MVPDRIKRTKIFGEFTSDEQEKYFGMKYKAVRTHIDTLYYFVRIRGDTNDSEHPGLAALLTTLAALKDEKKSNYSAAVDFHGLSVEATGFSIYEYRLSLPEMFDVFITKYLPNSATPRIVVQLRTRALILRGPYEAVRESMETVMQILTAYNLIPDIADVNRVDYAYHTNIIQNPMKYFNDDRLRQNLRSTMRKYMKVGRIGDELTLETLSLGNRKSNNIYFRCYDKTCEVIEKAYKSFFIDKWLQDGLISEYDHYVLMYAYSIGSYVAGLHVGRMKWYIEYGHDEVMKDKLRDLIEKYRQRSDNNKALKKNIDGYFEISKDEQKEIDGLLPTVTRIINIEFQTKRKLYNEILDIPKSVRFLDEPETCPEHDTSLDDILDEAEPAETPPLFCDPLLRPVFSVIALRGQIQKYLTSETVCWVDDRKKPGKDQKPLDWWHRIQACEIDREADCGEFVRKRELSSDVGKTVRRLKMTLAHLQIMRNLSTDPRSFTEDISDALCYLNDNDFYGFQSPSKERAFIFKEKDYEDIRKRKARQNKGLVRSVKAKRAKSKYKISELTNDKQNGV